MKQLFLIVAIVFIAACTKYRDVPNKSGTFVPPPTGTIAFGSLRINEFIAKGSDPGAVSLIGGTAKWFELYNPTGADITLTAGQWYVTDDLTNKVKCAITQNTNTAAGQWKVPSHGFLIVACPSTGSGSTTPSPSRFDASFSLSSTVGDIGIFYQSPSSPTLTPVDTISYNFGSGATSGKSYGRYPDGQGLPTNPRSTVTPEQANTN